ncbi:MAG TPA: hypothetical protein VHT30_09425 [Acidimicrobiales bacterium]|nr:hypothetical protein [Acidimicrobiales bacterium]
MGNICHTSIVRFEASPRAAHMTPAITIDTTTTETVMARIRTGRERAVVRKPVLAIVDASHRDFTSSK